MYPKELTENHQKGSNSNSRALHDHEKSQLLISGSPKNLFELTNPKKSENFVSAWLMYTNSFYDLLFNKIGITLI